MSRRVRVFVLALLTLSAILPAPAQATGEKVVWWGDTAPDKGFHFRIPMTVRNPHPFPITNGLVWTEIDIGARLIEAGWTKDSQGDRDVPKSFDLDLDSLRVVEVTDLDAPESGPAHGRLVTYDARFPTEDPRRYEVPSVAFAGSLTAEDARIFDPQTNPTVTLVWPVPRTLEPFAVEGGRRFFVVYFDSSRNGDHAPRSYADSPGIGPLQGLFWGGLGLTLHGNVAPSATEVGTVHVVPIHDDTQVAVAIRGNSGTYQTASPPAGFPSNPVVLDRLQATEMFVTAGRQAIFRVEASKPVFAFVEGTGFVPSLTGSFVGDDFVFVLNHDEVWEQDSVYFSTPGDDETVVEVQALTGGPTFLYEMNTPVNPRNHTVGARSGAVRPLGVNGACSVQDPTRPSPLLTTPGYYRARVNRGGPVLLQIASTRGMFQSPALTGAPTGISFLAAAGWTDQQFNHFGAPAGACLDTSRSPWFAAAAVDAAGTLTARSPDFLGQVYPTGRDPNHLPPAAPVGQTPDAHIGLEMLPLQDRPVYFQTNEPVSLFVGNAPPVARVSPLRNLYGRPDGTPERTPSGSPMLHGPLGGADVSRVFSGFGEATVIALFNDTTVQSRADHVQSDTASTSADLAAFGAVEIQDASEGDPVTAYRVEANRPVLVIPTQEHSAALAAVPPFLEAVQHTVDYRGYLVKLSSPTGLNPATDSTTPGVPVTFPVDVTNLARGIGGTNLPDTVRLDWTGPPGWTIASRQSVTLQSGQTERIEVSVTPPPNLPSGTVGQATIRATSAGNPLMEDSLQLVVLIRRSFGVGIWFDQVGNPQRTQTQFVSAGKEVVYNLTVKNTGGVADTIRVLKTEPGEAEWVAALGLLDGESADDIRLPAGGIARVQLVVRTGANANDATVITTITAASNSEPAAQDQVTAITRLRSPSDVDLVTPVPNAFVNPGETAFIPLVFSNRGAGSAELSFSLDQNADPDLILSGIVARDAQGRPSENLTQFIVIPGRSDSLWIMATATTTATAFSFTQVHLTARVSGSSQAVEAILQATVAPKHRIVATLPDLPLVAERDMTNLTVKIRFANQGNLDEHLTLRTSDLPPDWSLTMPSTLSLPTGDSQEFSASIGLPSAARAGTYNVQINLESLDGNRTLLALPVTVGGLGAGSVSAAAMVLARPGVAAVASYLVRNEGNVPVVVAMSAPSETWTWTSPQKNAELPPGAQVSVQVRYEVPPDAPDGVSTRALTLELRPTGSEGAAVMKPLSSQISVGRPDLLVAAVKAFRGPAGDLVRVEVQNVGIRAAQDVAVDLLRDGARLDRLLVQEIPPKSGSNLTLVAGPGAGETLRVVLDATGTNVEADEGNNAAQVQALPGAAPAPTPGLWTVPLVVLSAAAWIARRRP